MPTDRACDPHLLIFAPFLKEKVWGNARLADFGKEPPPGLQIGESWEIADLASTDPGGGGGGAARSVIRSGPLAGKTIHDAMTLWGRDLIGQAQPTAQGGFPLLIKFLDAGENLSVQTHPSPAYAATHPEAHLKTEAWLVLSAAPDAVIYKGLNRNASAEELGKAARDGSIVDLLRATPARPGDCYNLPTGVVHALGAGVLAAEVQTPSDTTFRLFDWGRTGRTLHIDQAVECATLVQDDSQPSRFDDVGRCRLLSNDAFTMDVVRLSPGESFTPRVSDVCAVWMVVEGAGTANVHGDATTLPLGATALVPAACASESRYCADAAKGAVVIEAAPAIATEYSL